MNLQRWWTSVLSGISTLMGSLFRADKFTSASEAMEKADSFVKSEDFDRAISAYTAAIRFDKTNAMAYWGRGRAYWRQGNLDKALPDYNEAIRLDPKMARAYYGRGAVYWKKGELDKALADFNRRSVPSVR